MLIDFENINPIERYRLMIQSIVPRPVAWVLTKNENESYNLAPFSYFNGLCSAPPLVMISIGYKQDKSQKDTRANIERNKEFVIHIASTEDAEAVTQTSAPLDQGISEVAEAKLELLEIPTWSLPRLRTAKLAMLCTLERVLEVGKNKQGIIFGEIKEFYVDDSIIEEKDGETFIDAQKLAPLSRLGGDDYMGPGKIITVKRPKYTPH